MYFKYFNKNIFPSHRSSKVGRSLMSAACYVHIHDNFYGVQMEVK